MDAPRAGAVWDALMETGRPLGITPAGLLALDIARIEAGLAMIDVDFVGARQALAASQRYSPLELGLAPLRGFREGALHRTRGACR